MYHVNNYQWLRLRENYVLKYKHKYKDIHFREWPLSKITTDFYGLVYISFMRLSAELKYKLWSIIIMISIQIETESSDNIIIFYHPTSWNTMLQRKLVNCHLFIYLENYKNIVGIILNFSLYMYCQQHNIVF